MKVKKSTKAIALTTLLAATIFLSACNSDGAATLLKKAEDATAPSSTVYTQQNYKDIYASAETFAAKFADATYASYDDERNFAVSPVSVYMALSLVSQCAAEDTKAELLTTLGLSDEVLTDSFSDFYGSLVSERKDDKDTLISALKLSNSVWVDNSVTPKQACMDTLAASYHCSSYQTDFLTDNKSANQAVQNFVKEQTNGLIDKNFGLSENTLFALINTLYLKDVWNTDNGLPETSDLYTFTNYKSETKETTLLQGSYIQGQAYEDERYSSFFTTTQNGYKLKFILPKDGYSVDDVFTQANIAKANAVSDYRAVDEENKVRYYTRCLFPVFKANYDEDVKDVLMSDFNINALFGANCNLSAFADPSSGGQISCDKIQHVTDLTVDKNGIEGAAVTVVSASESSSIEEKPYTKIYQDFIVNKSFGFVITNSRNVTLFSGVVKTI
jgi:serpin B